MSKSLGLLEVVGLSTAITVSDVMVKTANVTLADIEITKGMGYMTIKIKGDVAAVNASVSAGKTFAMKLDKFVSAKVIARPAAGVMENLAAEAYKDSEAQSLSTPKEVTSEEKKEKEESSDGDAEESEDHTEKPTTEVEEEAKIKSLIEALDEIAERIEAREELEAQEEFEAQEETVSEEEEEVQEEEEKAEPEKKTRGRKAAKSTAKAAKSSAKKTKHAKSSSKK